MKIKYIENSEAADAQADWFCPNTPQGLTQAGLARINQSIEAYVYCILAAQQTSEAASLALAAEQERCRMSL